MQIFFKLAILWETRNILAAKSHPCVMPEAFGWLVLSYLCKRLNCSNSAFYFLYELFFESVRFSCQYIALWLGYGLSFALLVSAISADFARNFFFLLFLCPVEVLFMGWDCMRWFQDIVESSWKTAFGDLKVINPLAILLN